MLVQDTFLHRGLILFLSALTNGITCGLINSYGLVYDYIKVTYKDVNHITTIASLIGSCQFGLLFLTSVVASTLIEKIGIRKTTAIGIFITSSGCALSFLFSSYIHVLIITYGVFVGVGSSLIYTCSISILFHYFDSNIGMATGFANFGGSVSTICFAFFLKYILDEYTLKGLMLSEAFLFLSLSLSIFVWIPKKDNSVLKESIKRESISSHEVVTNDGFLQSLQYLKESKYRNWSLSLSFMFITYAAPFLYTINYAKERGLPSIGTTLVMIMGIGSAVARLVIGKLSDLKCVDRIVVHQICCFVYAVVLLFIPVLVYSKWTLMGAYLFFGATDGLIFSLVAPIIKDILGKKRATQGLGLTLSCMAILLIFGPIALGKINDYLSTEIVFYISSVPCFITAFAMTICHKYSYTQWTVKK